MNVLAIEKKRIMKKRAIKQAQLVMTQKLLVCPTNK